MIAKDPTPEPEVLSSKGKGPLYPDYLREYFNEPDILKMY